MSHKAIPESFLDRWTQAIKDKRGEQLDDFPNHYLSDPRSLVTTCNPESLTVGHGAYIYKQTLLPAILSARHEVVLVTCFWAESETLSAIKEALEKLADRRRQILESSQDPYALPPLRIRIGFSSRSLLQKIFHPWSRDGYTYSPNRWQKLGLPPENVLMAARIDLEVKSLFFLPFSVMHPKFVIVDQQRAFMPSCNVSWETWFEGCVEITGPLVSQLVAFYRNTWERRHGRHDGLDRIPHDDQGRTSLGEESHLIDGGSSSVCRKLHLDAPVTPAILLPSSHHVNPAFRYFPFAARTTAPTTPLNAALLAMFATAQAQIDIVTPNLTCGTVVDALLDALARGVDVRIRTSYNMMWLEQVVTALTTTERTLKSLIRRYEQLGASGASPKARSDVEAQRPGLGRLEIYYWKPDAHAKGERDSDEPSVSHLKMTLVDWAYLVLGSGNLDRASWYTSQELGLLLYVPGFEHDIWDQVWQSRMEVRYRSGQGRP